MKEDGTRNEPQPAHHELSWRTTFRLNTLSWNQTISFRLSGCRRHKSASPSARDDMPTAKLRSNTDDETSCRCAIQPCWLNHPDGSLLNVPANTSAGRNKLRAAPAMHDCRSGEELDPAYDSRRFQLREFVSETHLSWRHLKQQRTRSNPDSALSACSCSENSQRDNRQPDQFCRLRLDAPLQCVPAQPNGSDWCVKTHPAGSTFFFF